VQLFGQTREETDKRRQAIADRFEIEALRGELDEALEDLRRRFAAPNWPEKETVADLSQGGPLAMIRSSRAIR
jgi:hypothetical protein